MKKISYLIALLCLSYLAQAQTKKLATENVILVTLDGMRWQEVFTGADSTLFKEQKNLKDPSGLAGQFWKDSPIERRKALMPFVWGVIASKGQLYGNRAYDNKVNVTNDQWFSYPGYNEILAGFEDKQINSNDKKYNPNTTVLEFIHKQPAFKGKVAAYTSWEVFPYIINDKRSGVLVNSGLQKASGPGISATDKELNELMPRVPNPLGEVRLDAFTFGYALEYVKRSQPRVLFLSFDETDDFAHAGEYGAYLHSAQNADYFIKQLWDYLQATEQYRNKTTLLITTDHGRGQAATGAWKSHGKDVEGADQIWLAVIGPDTPATGEQKSEGQYYQNQVAKTLAAFLGLTYTNDRKVGEVLAPAFGKAATAGK